MSMQVKDSVEVACPRCGSRQPQPRTAYSTNCSACHAYFRVQDARRPAPAAAPSGIQLRHVTCFQCGTELAVPATAESSMCKRCSCHIDLADYVVTKTLSKSFRTHGRLVVEEKGYLINTEAHVSDAVIKGRLIGRLTARHSLEIHSTANIKGTFTAGKLIIPPGQNFAWPESLQVNDAEISGELVASVCAAGTVHLRAGSRFFGALQALSLVVDAGAVVVGQLCVGKARESGTPART